MNKQKATDVILNIIWKCKAVYELYESDYFITNNKKLVLNIDNISKSFSGSWLGYHANVYYENFEEPLPGDYFDIEWGLKNGFGYVIKNKWHQVNFEQVKKMAFSDVDSEYEYRLTKISNEAQKVFEELKDTLSTLLNLMLEEKENQTFIEVRDEIKNINGFTSSDDITQVLAPKGRLMSRDSTAVSQGLHIPPHINIEAWHMSEYSPFDSLLKLNKCASKVHKYMEMLDMTDKNSQAFKGKKIFLGHGSSSIWEELKNFLKEKLNLDYEEFNREPVAGLSTIERLQQMLENSCFAFLVMTGEAQHRDDTVHARENVIHEAGLFQGRLGFRKAIILLEENCAEFSNITGLTQIRFRKGNISATFEEIKRVLKREGIINNSL